MSWLLTGIVLIPFVLIFLGWYGISRSTRFRKLGRPGNLVVISIVSLVSISILVSTGLSGALLHVLVLAFFVCIAGALIGLVVSWFR